MTGVAVVLAFGAAVLAREASDARTVRVEGEDDARLAALTDSVRAELTAAGFTVILPRDETEPSGVVRLRIADDHCAVVTATAIDAGKVFQSLVGCEGTPGTDPRAGDRVALQLAEWMEAATWLPPPPADPAPPTAVRQVVDLAEPRAPRGRRVSFSLDTLEVGTAAMRTPVFGTRFGVEVAVSTHGRSPIVAGATPFLRLSLAYDWLGAAVSDAAGEPIDVRYGTLTVAGGLSRRLTGRWSAEANVHLGRTLAWITTDVLATRAAASHPVSRSAWEITPGAAIAIVRDLSVRSSLALEAGATWLSPALIVQTPYATVGGSSFLPAITGALALRVKP